MDRDTAYIHALLSVACALLIAWMAWNMRGFPSHAAFGATASVAMILLASLRMRALLVVPLHARRQASPWRELVVSFLILVWIIGPSKSDFADGAAAHRRSVEAKDAGRRRAQQRARDRAMLLSAYRPVFTTPIELSALADDAEFRRKLVGDNGVLAVVTGRVLQSTESHPDYFLLAEIPAGQSVASIEVVRVSGAPDAEWGQLDSVEVIAYVDFEQTPNGAYFPVIRPICTSKRPHPPDR